MGRLKPPRKAAGQMNLLRHRPFRRWRRHAVQTGRAGRISLLWRPLSRATHGYFRYGYSIHGYSPFSSIAHTYCKSIAALGQKHAILQYKYPAIQPSGEYPKVSMYPCVVRLGVQEPRPLQCGRGTASPRGGVLVPHATNMKHMNFSTE